jgi:hypothetical protein
MLDLVGERRRAGGHNRRPGKDREAPETLFHRLDPGRCMV